MKVEQIRTLTDVDLVKELDSAHRELFNLRFRLATRQLANNREVVKVRRKIARVNTIMKERQLGIESGAKQ